MMRVADGTSLASLPLRGTHDSMSIHGGSLTECQEIYGNSGDTLTAQLKAGIRFFDIRTRINEGNIFTIHHGPTYQEANFNDVINKFSNFLPAHPAEAIIMRLKQECHAGSITSCSDASGQKSFVVIFDKYRENSPNARTRFWAPSVQRSSRAGMPKMGEIRGKIVLVVLQDSHGARTERYGLNQLAGWKDGNSQAIATKRDPVRRFLDKTNLEDQTALYVNFASG
ncbi:PLC-like phosphodiesterase [Mycena rebaudengoi]|nr:PLC-like phosphodiesterase [Mycena rebaudengoi]